jgi:hypothetical protein
MLKKIMKILAKVADYHIFELSTDKLVITTSTSDDLWGAFGSKGMCEFSYLQASVLIIAAHICVRILLLWSELEFGSFQQLIQ